MATIIIHKCDTCEDKIEGDVLHCVEWIDLIPNVFPIPVHNKKIFCSFNCMANFLKSEQERRHELDKQK